MGQDREIDPVEDPHLRTDAVNRQHLYPVLPPLGRESEGRVTDM